MRHTFRSEEIAHVWVNDIDRKVGHGKCGNTSFRGDAFYSYATVIARRFTTPSKKPFYILDAKTYSSTRRHQGMLSSALSGSSFERLCVYCGWHVRVPDNPEGVLAQLIAQAKDNLETAKTKGDRFKWPLYANAQETLNSARAFAKTFRLKVGNRLRILPSPAIMEKARIANEAWEQDVLERRQRRAELHAEQYRRHSESLANQVLSGRIKRERWHSPDLRHNPELQAKWNAFVAEQDKNAIADWLAGKDVAADTSAWPTMLRLEDDEIVTSRGARVPVTDGKRAFEFAMRFIKSGREWRRNGEQFHVGNYQLDSITKEGVIAGCHRFSWEEIERFAKVMGW